MSMNRTSAVGATKHCLFFRGAQTVESPVLNLSPRCISLGTAACRGDAPMTDYRVHAGDAQEDQVTAIIEKYTAPVPSSAYLGLAFAAIAASVTLQITQKEKANAALFVGQWVAPFLLLGIYNKLVKQHGSDAQTH
jgi:hypothetical protein